MDDVFVEKWRNEVTDSVVEMARLAPRAPEVDFASGLLATAVLWPVRAAVQEFDGDAIDAIRTIAGVDSKHILRAVQAWDDDRLDAARALATAAAANPALSEALASLVSHFDAGNLLASRLGTLPPETVNQIRAALVNIGGIINIASLTLNVTQNVTQAVEIPPPPRPEPPPEIGEFVGRSREIAYYMEMLATRHLAVISGMVGVGKTTLAAALARQNSRPDHVFWHTFHAREGIEVVIWKLAAFLAWHGQDELWRMLQRARLAGEQPPPAQTLFDYLLPMLGGHDYCLCLDDLHLVEEDALLIRLVDRLRGALGAKRLSLVITARRVPAFVKSAEADVLGGLVLEDAELLLQRWGLALAPPLFRRLYEHTGGNPQFLTLAITLLQHNSDATRAIDRLVESQDIERYLLAEVDERLSEAEQAVMSAVAVLLGYPASQDAIEAVLGGESVRRTLAGLADRHLLMVRERVEGRAYRQHGMVQAFYYDLLSGAKRRAMHLAAAEHYERDAPDLLAAAIHYEKAQAYAKSVALATQNVRPLISLYQARGLAELLNRFDEKRLSEVEWIRVNAALGQLYAFLGDRDKAKACYESTAARLQSMLEWTPENGEVRDLRLGVYQGLGQLHYNEAPAEALTWLQRGLDDLAHGTSSGEAAPTQATQEREAALYIDLAWAHRRLHNVGEAMDALQRGLQSLPRRPSQLRGDALTRLASLYVSQFDLLNAERYAEMAVENSRHLRDVWHEQGVRVMLGTIKHLGCDWQGATTEYEAALALATAIGDRLAQTALEVNLGVAQTNLGNAAPALAHLKLGLQLSQEGQLLNHELKAQISLARLHLRLGAWQAAEQHLEHAQTLVAKIDTTDAQFHVPLILSARAEAFLGRGDADQALALAQQSVAMAIEQEKQVDRAICQRVLAQALFATGESQQAETLLAESLPLLEGRQAYEAARIKALLGQFLAQRGDSSRSGVYMEQAQLTFQAIGAKFDLAELAPQ